MSCLYVYLSISLYLFPIYTSVYLSVCCLACHSFCQINRSPTYQFVPPTGLPARLIFLRRSATQSVHFFLTCQCVRLILLHPINESRSGILIYWLQTLLLLWGFSLVHLMFTRCHCVRTTFMAVQVIIYPSLIYSLCFLPWRSLVVLLLLHVASSWAGKTFSSDLSYVFM